MILHDNEIKVGVNVSVFHLEGSPDLFGSRFPESIFELFWFDKEVDGTNGLVVATRGLIVVTNILLIFLHLLCILSPERAVRGCIRSGGDR